MVAVLLVGGLVAGVSVFYANSRKDEATAPAPSLAPTAAAGGADGCIAGRDNDAKSLIEGAKKQAHTDEGAAATAAGFLRFAVQYPWPDEEQLAAVLSKLYVLDSGESVKDMAKTYQSISAPESARTAGYSLSDARYVIEPESTGDEVQVSIAAQAITDGTLNGGVLATTFTMAWSEGNWRLVDSEEITNEQPVLDTGAAFVGGC